MHMLKGLGLMACSLLTPQRHTGTGGAGHQPLLAIHDVTLYQAYRASILDHMCLCDQLPGPERSEKVDLQLKRGEGLACRQRTGIGHTHSGVSDVTQDTTVERSHRVRMLHCRFKLDDGLARLYGSKRKANQPGDRGRGEFAPIYLLDNV